MTEYRFRITPEIVPQTLLRKSFFAAWGRTPRPSQVEFEGNEMIVRSETRSSGTIHVPWPHKMLGVTVEATDSLLAREDPYLLLKELGRGSLGRLSRKLFEWQLLGFRQSPELKEKTTEISRRFSQAVVADDTNPEVESEFVRLIGELTALSIEYTEAYTDQAIAWRTRNNERLPIHFGVGMNRHPYESLYEFDLYAGHLQEAFHAVLPMPSWRELEPEPGLFCWEHLESRLINAARYGFEIFLGPLISFESSALPRWLLSRIHEDGTFESCATRFVNAMAERYGSLAHGWILADCLNSFSLDMPQTRGIALVRILAQQIRSRGIETPILVGINQPWGEFALKRTPELDQIHVAESLIGCHEIDSFLLGINFGFDGHSTFPRDPMAISSMIDQWSFLGKKVYIAFSVPSQVGDDSADMEGTLEPEYQWSEGLQLYWTEILLRMILGKRTVGGIFWTSLQDPPDDTEETKNPAQHGSMFSGLIDSQCVVKLAFKRFESLRKILLKE